MGPEHQDIREGARDSMKDLNVEMALENGAKVHEVQDGDTLWDIVKTEYGFTNDSEVANSIIKISKVNMMNDTIKKDSLSVIDGRVVNSSDGIPGDLIFAGEKIIIEIEAKGVSPEIKQAELEDTDNELPNLDVLLNESEMKLNTRSLQELYNLIGDSEGVEGKNKYGKVVIKKISDGSFRMLVTKKSDIKTKFYDDILHYEFRINPNNNKVTTTKLSDGSNQYFSAPTFSVEDVLNDLNLNDKGDTYNGYNAEGNPDYYTNIEDGGTGGVDGGEIADINNFEYILKVLEERELNNTRRQGRSVNIRRLTTKNIQIKVENDYGQGSDYFILNPEGETIRSYQVRLGNIIVEKPKTNRTIGDLTELIKIDQVNLNNEREGRKNRQEKRKNFIKKFFPL